MGHLSRDTATSVSSKWPMNIHSENPYLKLHRLCNQRVLDGHHLRLWIRQTTGIRVQYSVVNAHDNILTRWTSAIPRHYLQRNRNHEPERSEKVIRTFALLLTTSCTQDVSVVLVFP